ncbi:MAG: hypothetical protein QOJ51_6539 [Acidobacteriaceae bacterium]|nr:hypothetical protein [Acidobacteriaceae bacterium]MEA2263714.1 hypothetical protein [Acidobacteriaceae bacterium]
MLQKAELSGDADSENNHGGSSRSYVLHRTGYSQEDDRCQSDAMAASESSAYVEGLRRAVRDLPGARRGLTSSCLLAVV